MGNLSEIDPLPEGRHHPCGPTHEALGEISKHEAGLAEGNTVGTVAQVSKGGG